MHLPLELKRKKNLRIFPLPTHPEAIKSLMNSEKPKHVFRVKSVGVVRGCHREVTYENHMVQSGSHKSDDSIYSTMLTSPFPFQRFLFTCPLN
ncbi:hypothetical protein ERO13_A11G203650v2 [Gossypium hirsutum]|uniref:Uncharacterized protein n=1 Tax=Gossypium darwinii TaxID=34276 RepID=A0A5D2EQ20_GOSDA|nr:hypothetical protein ERO13_A11G203650v2 [Gossypium hirsutum]TYG94988.1 hypothetical protein ES288_A11G231700v1 [Gossypium darwinii]